MPTGIEWVDITPRVLLDVVEDLDAAETVDHDTGWYLEITRWTNGGGQADEEATALVRQLVRERLGTFKLADVGAAALARIDERTPDAETRP